MNDPDLSETFLCFYLNTGRYIQEYLFSVTAAENSSLTLWQERV